ncbi:hypothetical protein HVPorG_04761 (plasmid) [Roseomonas mucosa]|nr:hypothetical protein HVPorG_04761 [Roseomonas mucosa]
MNEVCMVQALAPDVARRKRPRDIARLATCSRDDATRRSWQDVVRSRYVQNGCALPSHYPSAWQPSHSRSFSRSVAFWFADYSNTIRKVCRWA